MKINLSKRLKLQFSLSAAALCIALVNGFSGARASQNTSDSLGNDDTEFVFAGKCPNGESTDFSRMRNPSTDKPSRFMTTKDLQVKAPSAQAPRLVPCQFGSAGSKQKLLTISKLQFTP